MATFGLTRAEKASEARENAASALSGAASWLIDSSLATEPGSESAALCSASLVANHLLVILRYWPDGTFTNAGMAAEALERIETALVALKQQLCETVVRKSPSRDALRER